MRTEALTHSRHQDFSSYPLSNLQYDVEKEEKNAYDWAIVELIAQKISWYRSSSRLRAVS